MNMKLTEIVECDCKVCQGRAVYTTPAMAEQTDTETGRHNLVCMAFSPLAVAPNVRNIVEAIR